MIRFFTKNIYLVLSLLLIISSIFGGTYLVKQTQDTRRQATDESCTPIGKELCQENTQGKNTGFLCTCTAWSQYETTYGYWDCETKNLNECPTESGGTDPTIFTCTEANARIEGRCLKAVSGTLSVVNLYQCPNKFDTSGGCQDTVQTFRNVTEVCFESNFCGVQQIDYTSNCFMSTVDDICLTPSPTIRPSNTPTPTTRPSNTPTPTRIISNTPTPTRIISNTPTLTPRPTNTPTNTPTPTRIISNTPTLTPNPSFTLTPTTKPTNTPTNTPKPTNTPTTRIVSGTPVPTNTLVPTLVIAQGPSPTRIVLPEAGIDFPAKTLSIVGIIVTLLGFLILL